MCWFHRLVGRAFACGGQGGNHPSLSSPPRICIGRLHKISQEPILCNLQNSEIYKMSQHNITDNVNSFNNTNVWNTYTVANERSEILAWLSPLELQRRHHDIQTRRVDEVGGWLLQTQEYRNWFGDIRVGESDGAALFCYGGPGVGKTFIR